MNMTRMNEALRVLLKNEFTCVEISVDREANGPRLKIVDLVSGDAKYLDPIVVESLTRMPNDAFDRYIMRGEPLT